MHLKLKQEAIKPPRPTPAQQARFDDFLALFNEERPHQALEMRVPAELTCARPAYAG